MPDLKKYLPLVITIIAGVAIILLWDTLQDWFLGIFGLGAAGAAVYAAQSKKLQAQAEVHDEMKEQHLVESGIKMQQSTEAHDKAVEIANKPKEGPSVPRPGFKRKRISSK